MAEATCVECNRLHDTYNTATIRYMKFYECRQGIQESPQGNQLFTEMNDAMLAFFAHQTNEHLPKQNTLLAA
jgi:hypothetical protein